MGARYDQVEPHVGIVRAKLAADLTVPADGQFGPKGFSLNASGLAVLGTGGQTGLVGVVVKNLPRVPGGFATQGLTVNNWMGARAKDVVDIMTLGEIILDDDTPLVAGTVYYCAPNGDLVTDSNAGANPKVGFTAEATRLIVQPGVGLRVAPLA